MRFRPAARIAHEGLDLFEFGFVEFFALLGDREDIPPGGEVVQAHAELANE